MATETVCVYQGTLFVSTRYISSLCLSGHSVRIYSLYFQFVSIRALCSYLFVMSVHSSTQVKPRVGGGGGGVRGITVTKRQLVKGLFLTFACCFSNRFAIDVYALFSLFGKI